jgi:hypothetical protein
MTALHGEIGGSGSADESQYHYKDAPSLQLQPWTEPLLRVKQRAERWYNERTGVEVSFNVCLGNYYIDGQNRIGWHTDRGARAPLPRACGRREPPSARSFPGPLLNLLAYHAASGCLVSAPGRNHAPGTRTHRGDRSQHSDRLGLARGTATLPAARHDEAGGQRGHHPGEWLADHHGERVSAPLCTLHPT